MRLFGSRWLLIVFAGTLAWTFYGCSSDNADSANSANSAKSSSHEDQLSATEDPASETTHEDVTVEDPDMPDLVAPQNSIAQEIEVPMSATADFKPLPRSATGKMSSNAKPDFSSRYAPSSARSYSSPSFGSAAPPVQPVQPAAEPVSQPVAAPPSDTVPAAMGAAKRQADGFTEVKVFYGTDRNRETITATSPETLKAGVLATIVLLICATGLLVFNRLKSSLVIGGAAAILFGGLYFWQQDAPMRDGISYGVARGSLVRGVSTVTVPKTHQRGMVERPSILRLEFTEDKNKHVVLAQATELSSDEFYRQMSASLEQTDDPDLLLFVHGFNVAFDEAIRRTAQIATDLSFDGVPVCYSWPSQGSLLGYPIDENNVIWTVPHLRDFLLELADKSQARSINIIAHSMGNRAVTASLSDLSMQLTQDKLPLVDQVVLAAPDVDADHFRKELAPRLAEVARHVTLYASSDDQALVASKHLHGGYPRAGESGENLVVVPEIETIDVSGIDLSLLGHNYYGSSESILRDLFDVVRNRLPARKRTGLISQRLRDTTYWLLARPQLSEHETTPMR